MAPLSVAHVASGYTLAALASKTLNSSPKKYHITAQHVRSRLCSQIMSLIGTNKLIRKIKVKVQECTLNSLDYPTVQIQL